MIEVRDLKVWFPILKGVVFQRRLGWIRAVDGVSFAIKRGETLGLVGESGSGKSTIARAVMQLIRPTAGEVLFRGMDLSRLGEANLRSARREMQMIFQDPYSSFNPRIPVGSSIGEGLDIFKLDTPKARAARVREVISLVGLDPRFANRYPHEFSGGQCQRLAIARALAINPTLIICDEPVSSLDVSIRAQIINLLDSLQREFGLTYLFIAHDLAVVRHLAHRVAVMYLGKVVETAGRDSLYANPLHPYTQALLSASPIPNPIVEKQRPRIVLSGEIPNPANPPTGCHFRTRCPNAREDCQHVEPPLLEAKPEHWVACHHWSEGERAEPQSMESRQPA